MANLNKHIYASSEDMEQEAVIEYCDLKSIPVIHVANEGKRSAFYGAKLKRMGLRKGVPDLFFPCARKGYHGLFIELKYGKGKTSKEQQDWISSLRLAGYAVAVCIGFDGAVKVIDEYMKY